MLSFMILTFVLRRLIYVQVNLTVPRIIAKGYASSVQRQTARFVKNQRTVSSERVNTKRVVWNHALEMGHATALVTDTGDRDVKRVQDLIEFIAAPSVLVTVRARLLMPGRRLAN